MDHTELKNEDGSQPTSSWTIDVSDIRTIKVSNVSIAASKKDISELFSYPGDIHFIEMQRESETTQIAYVTFRDSKGAETAMLLTGATIVGLSVTPAENYQLPPNAPSLNSVHKSSSTGSAIEKAEDVVSTMLAKGFILGKDAFITAKSFDEKHHLTLNASSTFSSIDSKIGLSKNLSMGASVVNEKVKGMEKWFHTFEMTKSALIIAEDKASGTGSNIMRNRYVTWVTNMLGAVSKAAGDVSAMTKEKVEKAEKKRETFEKERMALAYSHDYFNNNESPVA